MSLWSANAGMKAVFDALNVAYDEKEKRNFVFLNLWSLAFTVASVLFLIIALSAVVVIPVILKYIGLGEVTDWIVWVGRWPALLLITFLALAVLYRYGASRDRARWSWLAPGTLLAGLGWMAFSMLFSWYVSSFGNYNETYGSLGAAIGFMTWMWLSATILLVRGRAQRRDRAPNGTRHDRGHSPASRDTGRNHGGYDRPVLILLRQRGNRRSGHVLLPRNRKSRNGRHGRASAKHAAERRRGCCLGG